METEGPPSAEARMRATILGRIDFMIEQFFDRIESLGDREHLWEPVDDPAQVWSVRATAEGTRGAVDGLEGRDLTPAPITTIAWRMWHLGVDCFATYVARFEARDTTPDPTWPLDASSSIVAVKQGWQQYRATVAAFDDWFAELGPGWGPFATATIADMVEHCGNEIVHHGAEIALLRDLYRIQVGETTGR